MRIKKLCTKQFRIHVKILCGSLMAHPAPRMNSRRDNQGVQKGAPRSLIAIRKLQLYQKLYRKRLIIIN